MDFKNKFNLLEFIQFQKSILKKYKIYIHGKMEFNYKKAAIFVYWLNDYIEYIRQEDRFNPNQNITYHCGQIVLVNFGYRIGRELGGSHYAIVIDVKNSSHASTLTVVPLKSYKGKETNYSKIYCIKLNSDIKGKLYAKGTSIKSEIYNRLLEIASNLNKPTNTLDDQNLKLERAKLKRRNKLAEDAISYSKKLKNGSIADVGQITTISKQRIIQPCKPNDVLSDIRINQDDLNKIEEKIRFLYFKS